VTSAGDVAVALVACGCGLLAQSCKNNMTIAQRAMPAVAVIATYDAHGNAVNLGSGFVVDSSGLVVSSLHVIENAADATVTLLTSGRAFRHPTVVGFDARTDLAVLRVSATGLPTLVLSRRASAVAGERVLAIGNPEGLVGSLSDGIVSSVRRDEAGLLYQLTAPLSPGSSGGPVIDDKGDVIGVVESSIGRGQNLNFARSVAGVVPLLQQAQTLTLTQLSTRLLRTQGRSRSASAADEDQRGVSKRVSGPTIVQAVIQNGGTELELAPGRLYLYGLTTGGGAASTAFAAGQVAQALNPAGQLAAALSYGTDARNSYTTETAFHAIGGVSVTGTWTTVTAFRRSGPPPMGSVSFTVSGDALVVVIGLGASQQYVALAGLPGLTTDAENQGDGTEAMVISHATVGAGRYTVTETTRAVGGQDPSHMVDLLGAFVFTR
jgi:S1-C subfamily serine protease